MKYVLVFCNSGNATLVVDENEFELSADETITITSGQIHYFKNINNPAGFILELRMISFAKMITTSS